MNTQKIFSPPDQAARTRIETELDRCLLVEAAAGTGKTTCMVRRMVALLAAGPGSPDIGQVAAVTFTRKAAAELRGRFRTALEQAARGSDGDVHDRLTRALADLDKCFIGTIHSFCARLLRERPVEAGVDVAFVEIEPEDDELLREEAWELFVSGLTVDDPDRIGGGLEELGCGVSELKEAFLRFCEYPDVDTWPVSELDDRLPVQETAAKIGRYVERMLGWEERFPADPETDTLIPRYRIVPRVVSHHPELERAPELIKVLDLLKKKADFKVTKWTKERKITKEEARAENEYWEAFQEDTVVPLLYRIQEQRYRIACEAFLEARKIYDRLRAERGVLNYQDLLMKAAALLAGHSHVREYFQRRLRHLLVDEFQDTDPVQAEVMLLLTAEDPREIDWRRCRPRPGALFVVGDPKQSIYRFRRADIVTYTQVKDIIRESGDVVHLFANFRGSRTMIEWVNRGFEPAGEVAEGKAMTRFPEADTPQSPSYVPLKPGRDDGPDGDLFGAYVLTAPEECGNKDQVSAYESDRIARTIRHAVDTGVTVARGRNQNEGRPGPAAYSDFMIVTPKTGNLSVFAAALERYRVPHWVTGGSALNEVPELRLLYHCLLAVVRPDDPVALVAVLRGELFGLSDAGLYNYKKAGGRFSFHAEPPPELDRDEVEIWSDAFARLRRYAIWLALLPAPAALEKIIADLGLMELAGSREGGPARAGALAKVVELVREAGARAGAWSTSGLAEFLGRLVDAEQKYDGSSVRSESDDRVRVMNLHKVKGLEAPVVFLADPGGEFPHPPDLHIDRKGDAVQGFLLVQQDQAAVARPPNWDRHEAAEKNFRRAEELRLRYVAATRAGAAIIITQRAKGNHTNPWQYFQLYIPAGRELPDPGEPAPIRSRTGPALTAPETRAAYVRADLRRGRGRAPSDAAVRAKDLAPPSGPPATGTLLAPAPSGPGPAADGPRGEYGVEWGMVVHLLLQQAMKNPDGDLDRLAAQALRTYELGLELAPEAVKTVQTVMRSSLWQRARDSHKRLVEAPFQILMTDQGLPAIVRGVIDLVFQEPDGWVVADYKTGAFGGDPKQAALRYGPQLSLYAEAWQKVTGHKVSKKLVYFVDSDCMVEIS